jgi:hypothetical protein
MSSSSLMNEILSFDWYTGFRNTFDIHFLEHDEISYPCDLRNLIFIKNLVTNMCRFKSLFDKFKISDYFILINQDCKVIIDYRLRGNHYHVFLPKTYSLVITDLNLIVNHTCPICYERIRCEVYRCARCGATTCFTCSFLIDKCCLCRYDPCDEFNENFVFSSLRNNDLSFTPFNLYFSSNDRIICTKVDDANTLCLFLSRKEWVQVIDYLWNGATEGQKIYYQNSCFFTSDTYFIDFFHFVT